MYRQIKCVWCGVVRRVGDDHFLWCPEFPRAAIDAARAAQEGKRHG